MALGRDKDETVEPTISLAALEKLLERFAPKTAEQEKELIKIQAEAQAEAQKRALRPENDAPHILSSFHPSAHRARPHLRCDMTWAGGFPLYESTLSDEEIDLLNQVEPGSFLCTKSDGSKVKVTVEASTKQDGSYSKVHILFPTRGEGRHNLPPMTAMLREMLTAAKTGTASVA